MHTGRTHQIRVHLHHAGHSLVGDIMYGLPPEIWLSYWENGPSERVLQAAGAPRQALHAAKICFEHPNGESLAITSPIPEDMRRIWGDLPEQARHHG